MPIKDVEISVDGTKYYDISKTNGSFSIRLEEYTVGDEITVTTSHKDFEDKSMNFKINGPEMKGVDFFLNPVSKKPNQ